jgi:RNA polymerase sigma-70 factor (ECF subfamily)
VSEPLRKRTPALVAGASDAEILACIAGGDAQALGALFDRHAEAVRRLVLRLGVRPGEADDLVQVTFLDVLRTAPAYDGRADARPWLLAMATMRVRRHRRSFARLTDRLVRFGREPQGDARSPERDVGEHREATRALEALERLSEKKREVFVLVALEGLTCEEVAERLEIPVGTVWTRLHHARAELRAALEEKPR